MAFTSWRGLVGMINPTMRPGMTEEVIRLLPEGIGVIPLFLNITRGTREEFETMMAAYEAEIERLVPQECDLIPTALRPSWSTATPARPRSSAPGKGRTRCRSSPPGRTT